MKVYIAAPFVDPDRAYVRALKALIEEEGHEVTSRWIGRELPEEAGPLPLQSPQDVTERLIGYSTDYLTREAKDDLADIRASEVVVLVTSPEGGHGKEVEMGYALSHGIPIIILGKVFNVFHYLAARVRTPAEALDLLNRLDDQRLKLIKFPTPPKGGQG